MSFKSGEREIATGHCRCGDFHPATSRSVHPDSKRQFKLYPLTLGMLVTCALVGITIPVAVEVEVDEAALGQAKTSTLVRMYAAHSLIAGKRAIKIDSHPWKFRQTLRLLHLPARGTDKPFA